MNPSTRLDTDGFSNFQVVWEDGDRVFCRGWRLGTDGNRSAVLAVLPAVQHPAPAILDRLAPEQTGRMNRSIDSRSDLYALGISFYQMLTGALPFTAADPMEWVHCHIARQPVAPSKRLTDVPAAISTIIMKLLAKAAEERYQTAAGLERDLRRCLADWERQGRIDDFPLGQGDIPDRLLIPEKLYGRERETLLAAFERVVQSGAPELVLVSGYSGIGKSSVVNELHKALVPPRALFASGKFDQFKRDVPYATLAQAPRSWTTISSSSINRWNRLARSQIPRNHAGGGTKLQGPVSETGPFSSEVFRYLQPTKASAASRSGSTST